MSISYFDILKSPLEGTNLIEASAGTGKTYTIAGLFLRLILEKGIPIDKILAVTYTEAATEELRNRIREKGLESNFRLLGYIEKEEVFNSVVRKHRIGLAPYRPDDISVKNFAGVARPWTYMANGVPPIITRVPPDAREIEETQAGLVIDYDKEQLARAILMLLKDDQLHQRCRERGMELAKSRATVPIFNTLLIRLGFSPAGYAESAGGGVYHKESPWAGGSHPNLQVKERR